MKKLAIDIDGVLAHPGKFIKAMCQIIGVEIEYENFPDHRMDKAFGKTVEEVTIAHQEIDKIFSFESSAPRYGSKKAVKELSKYFEIIILTGRQGRYEEQTGKWIRSHFGKQKIIHASATNAPYANERDTTKLDICRQLKIDFIIEDNPYEIEEILKSKTKPVCLGWSVNKEYINHPKVFRGNWREVANYLINRA